MNFDAKQKQICVKAISYILVLVVVFANFSFAPVTLAEDATSTNFILRDPINSTFGGNSTSTNFEQLNAGGQSFTGESSSTNFILRSGFLYFSDYSPVSQNWRWYDDETNETPSSALANENVAPSDVAFGNIIKLRLTIAEDAGVVATDIKFKIQFSEYSDFSQGVTTVVATTTCTVTSLWCYGNGTDNDDDAVTTRVLTDSDVVGRHNETATGTSTFDPAASTPTEFEFTLKHSGATYNTTYFFRAYDVTTDKAVPLGAGESYPSLSAQGVALTFSIGGLGASTATEGITTDFVTTALTVPFGSLSIDTETEGAQRLTATTNSADGYKIFVFERQGFLHSAYVGVEIAEVTGTNSSPSAWATGCVSSAAGCYGYHPGDDTLSSGSTRFSADDTYAKLTSTAEEIAFNSGPVASEVTDVIFKSQITNQQKAGDYTSNIVYIIVPTF